MSRRFILCIYALKRKKKKSNPTCDVNEVVIELMMKLSKAMLNE